MLRVDLTSFGCAEQVVFVVFFFFFLYLNFLFCYSYSRPARARALQMSAQNLVKAGKGFSLPFAAHAENRFRRAGCGIQRYKPSNRHI